MLEQLQREMCKLGTDQIQQFGRPLTSHLVETGRWPEKWGYPRTMFAAGAFHAIYGMRSFIICDSGLEGYRASHGDQLAWDRA